MDIKNIANIQATIGKDNGSLNGCVEYVATVVLCWGRAKFEEHKETLQLFLSLREKGQIPAYITPEDMRDWIISEGRNILRDRFQVECAHQRDGLIHLAWEVNMRLKMQDIFMELGLTTSSSTLLSDQDFQQEALSDLQSSAMAEIPFRSIFPLDYFDPDTVVRRAVRDMIQQLAHLPVARPHTVSELVVDTVTRLFRTVMDDGDPIDRRSSSRLLSGVAVGTTAIVLQEVCAEERCAGAQELRVQYSHSTRASMMSTLHRELLEQMESPEVLKAALRGKRGALNSTISSVITGVIINLLKPPLRSVLEAAAIVENVLDAATAVESVLDTAAAVKNVLDTATAGENILDAETAVQDILDAAAVENGLAGAAVENVLDAAAVENVPDAAAAVEDVLDTAAVVEIILDIAAVVENILDAVTAMENILDAETAAENILDAETAVENVFDAAAVENVLDVAAAVENVLDAAAAVENVLDAAAVVENVLDAAVAAETVLDVVSLQEHQLEEFPQKVKKQRKGIRRFFSRMWEALRHSTFCCCCCVSVDTD